MVIGDAVEDWVDGAAGKEPHEGHLGLANGCCNRTTSPLAWMVEGDWKVMHHKRVNTGPCTSPGPSWIVRCETSPNSPILDLLQILVVKY